MPVASRPAWVSNFGVADVYNNHKASPEQLLYRRMLSVTPLNGRVTAKSSELKTKIVSEIKNLPNANKVIVNSLLDGGIVFSDSKKDLLRATNENMPERRKSLSCIASHGRADATLNTECAKCNSKSASLSDTVTNERLQGLLQKLMRQNTELKKQNKLIMEKQKVLQDENAQLKEQQTILQNTIAQIEHNMSGLSKSEETEVVFSSTKQGFGSFSAATENTVGNSHTNASPRTGSFSTGSVNASPRSVSRRPESDLNSLSSVSFESEEQILPVTDWMESAGLQNLKNAVESLNGVEPRHVIGHSSKTCSSSIFAKQRLVTGYSAVSDPPRRRGAPSDPGHSKSSIQKAVEVLDFTGVSAMSPVEGGRKSPDRNIITDLVPVQRHSPSTSLSKSDSLVSYFATYPNTESSFLYDSMHFTDLMSDEKRSKIPCVPDTVDYRSSTVPLDSFCKEGNGQMATFIENTTFPVVDTSSQLDTIRAVDPPLPYRFGVSPDSYEEALVLDMSSVDSPKEPVSDTRLGSPNVMLGTVAGKEKDQSDEESATPWLPVEMLSSMSLHGRIMRSKGDDVGRISSPVINCDGSRILEADGRFLGKIPCVNLAAQIDEQRDLTIISSPPDAGDSVSPSNVVDSKATSPTSKLEFRNRSGKVVELVGLYERTKGNAINDASDVSKILVKPTLIPNDASDINKIPIKPTLIPSLSWKKEDGNSKGNVESLPYRGQRKDSSLLLDSNTSLQRAVTLSSTNLVGEQRSE